jgi:DNA replication protein DnaC
MPTSEATATCPRCGGRGWLVVSDGKAGSARSCPCREEGAVSRLLAAAGIPPRYQHCKLSNFQPAREFPQLLQGRTVAERYAAEFLQEGGGFRRSGLLFLGPPGVGKTHLAAGVLRDVVERYRVRGRFVEFTALIHQIQSTFDPGSPESKREILDPLMTAELLVLDELGSQQLTPWVREILYLIINHRYTRQLPTLFTTNYRLESMRTPAQPEAATAAGALRPRRDEPELLSSRLPAMLVSRLYEMAQPVDLTAVEDFRREHKVHGAYLR